MADNGNIVNFPSRARTIAKLTNVSRFVDLIETLKDRPIDLPGLGVFSGAAGLGKTMASIYAANVHRAHVVECDFTWTQKAFCEAVMGEIGLLVKGAPTRMPIYRAVGEIGDYFAENPGRPLIVDEADFLVRRKMIEIVRAIYKYCAPAGASIVLIGEESMPKALKVWERVDSRVLMSVQALPLDLADAVTLANLICPGITFEDGVVGRLRQAAGGSARRIVARLHGLRQIAQKKNLTAISMSEIEGAA